MLSRASRLALLCFAAAIVAIPLAVQKPGLPSGLKADEPAYYLMGLSLGRDFDLRCDTRDLERLFAEFPYDSVRNLIVMTDDGWNTVYFGKPFVYSLLAAPFAVLFGANGFVALNMAMIAWMILLGTRYLARFNAEPVALLFSVGFFLLSTAPAYGFWIHPEIFNMTAIFLCLYLGFLPRPDGIAVAGRLVRVRAALSAPAVRMSASGAVLALAVYNKPVFAAMGLPVLLLLARGRRWRDAGSWCLGAMLAMLALAGVSTALTGHPSAYLGVERAGVRVDAPGHLVGVVPRAGAAEQSANTDNSWSWIFYVPREGLRKLPENLFYFMLGRHTGLIPYLPWSTVCLLLFVGYGARSVERWSILAALGLVALFFLLFIHFNWHGGGGFVGNRYFVSAYPGFLFLVTRIAPASLLPVTYALSGLLVGPLILAPFGAPVVHPTLQWHVRNAPFGIFPFELGIDRQIPGYRGAAAAGGWIMGRKDVFLPLGDELFVRSGGPVEIWLKSENPLPDAVFEVSSLARENRISVEVGGERRVVRFSHEAPDARTVRLEIPFHGPSRVSRPEGEPIYCYRIVVEAQRGSAVDGDMSDDAGFVAGARLVYFGSRAELAADVYHAEWTRVAVPPDLPAGQRAIVPVAIRNASGSWWRGRGGGHVALAYHWLRPDGSLAIREGWRTALKQDVAPGATLEIDMGVDTPGDPGEYELVLDPVREGVAWFGDRDSRNTLRRRVSVVPRKAAGPGDLEGSGPNASSRAPEVP